MLTALIGLLGIGGIAGAAIHFLGWAGTLAKLTSFGRGAKDVAAKTPRWVWIALAAVAVVLGGYFYISHKIHQAYAEGSKAGHAAQFAHDQAEMNKARAKARDFKDKLDTANTKIHNQEQARHDQTVAANHALADALRLRARASAVHPVGRGGANLPGTAPAADRTGGARAQADADVGAGADAGTVCVPAGPLIDYAEQADNDHDALEKTEDAWKRYREHWPSTAAPPAPQ